MAQPKELPTSLLARQPWEKIGSYYLSLALDPNRQIHPDRPYQPCTFTFVQLETHDNLMGGTIPFSLTRQMRLNQYNWQQNHPFQLTRFFWGSNHQSSDIQEALGTVEIARQSHPKTDPRKPETEYRHSALVRLAGVDQATHRVIALTYNARGAMELERLDISLAEGEFEPIFPGDIFYDSRFSNISASAETGLTTLLDDPYMTAGLVTESMAKQTVITGKEHTRYLQFQGERALPFVNTTQTISRDGITVSHKKVSIDDTFYVIGFPGSGNSHDREVVIPRKLELADF